MEKTFKPGFLKHIVYQEEDKNKLQLSKTIVGKSAKNKVYFKVNVLNKINMLVL